MGHDDCEDPRCAMRGGEVSAERAAGYLVQCMAAIDEHGWMLQGVLASPFYNYTIGLSKTDFEHPEFVLAGLDPALSSHLLNELGGRVRKGETFHHGQRVSDLIDGYDVVLIECDVSDHFGILTSLYPDPKMLQVVWPDPKGLFPWDEGHDPHYDDMPLFGKPPKETT